MRRTDEEAVVGSPRPMPKTALESIAHTFLQERLVAAIGTDLVNALGAHSRSVTVDVGNPLRIMRPRQLSARKQITGISSARVPIVEQRVIRPIGIHYPQSLTG